MATLAELLRLEGGAYSGYPNMPKNQPRTEGKVTGFLAGASGFPQNPNKSVLDPNDVAYMQAYNAGEPVSMSAMALPAYGALAKFAAPKAAQYAEALMQKQGMMPTADAYHGTPHTIQSKSEEIKNAAEEFAKKIKELGFSADVNHSGSKAGASSYVTVYDPTTGRYVKDPFRFSGHSKGPFQSQFVNEISDLEKQFPDIQNTLMAMREQGLSPAVQLKNTQQLKVDELVKNGMKPKSAWKQILNKKFDEEALK